LQALTAKFNEQSSEDQALIRSQKQALTEKEAILQARAMSAVSAACQKACSSHEEQFVVQKCSDARQLLNMAENCCHSAQPLSVVLLQALQHKEAALQQQLAQLQKALQDKTEEVQQQSHAHGLQKQVGCW
jgi:hypothetical protein